MLFSVLEVLSTAGRERIQVEEEKNIFSVAITIFTNHQ